MQQTHTDSIAEKNALGRQMYTVKLFCRLGEKNRCAAPDPRNHRPLARHLATKGTMADTPDPSGPQNPALQEGRTCWNFEQTLSTSWEGSSRSEADSKQRRTGGKRSHTFFGTGRAGRGRRRGDGISLRSFRSGTTHENDKAGEQRKRRRSGISGK